MLKYVTIILVVGFSLSDCCCVFAQSGNLLQLQHVDLGWGVASAQVVSLLLGPIGVGIGISLGVWVLFVGKKSFGIAVGDRKVKRKPRDWRTNAPLVPWVVLHSISFLSSSFNVQKVKSNNVQNNEKSRSPRMLDPFGVDFLQNTRGDFLPDNPHMTDYYNNVNSDDFTLSNEVERVRVMNGSPYMDASTFASSDPFSKDYDDLPY